VGDFGAKMCKVRTRSGVRNLPGTYRKDLIWRTEGLTLKSLFLLARLSADPLASHRSRAAGCSRHRTQNTSRACSNRSAETASL
jgi:hypothetical protein